MNLNARYVVLLSGVLKSGARIEIPPGATAGALGEDGAETVTVTIQEVEPPAGMGE